MSALGDVNGGVLGGDGVGRIPSAKHFQLASWISVIRCLEIFKDKAPEITLSLASAVSHEATERKGVIHVIYLVFSSQPQCQVAKLATSPRVLQRKFKLTCQANI